MKPRNVRSAIFLVGMLILAVVLGFLATGVFHLTTEQTLLFILAPLVLITVSGYLLFQRTGR